MEEFISKPTYSRGLRKRGSPNLLIKKNDDMNSTFRKRGLAGLFKMRLSVPLYSGHTRGQFQDPKGYPCHAPGLGPQTRRLFRQVVKDPLSDPQFMTAGSSLSVGEDL